LRMGNSPSDEPVVAEEPTTRHVCERRVPRSHPRCNISAQPVVTNGKRIIKLSRTHSLSQLDVRRRQEAAGPTTQQRRSSTSTSDDAFRRSASNRTLSPESEASSALPTVGTSDTVLAPGLAHLQSRVSHNEGSKTALQDRISASFAGATSWKEDEVLFQLEVESSLEKDYPTNTKPLESGCSVPQRVESGTSAEWLSQFENLTGQTKSSHTAIDAAKRGCEGTKEAECSSACTPNVVRLEYVNVRAKPLTQRSDQPNPTTNTVLDDFEECWNDAAGNLSHIATSAKTIFRPKRVSCTLSSCSSDSQHTPNTINCGIDQLSVDSPGFEQWLAETAVMLAGSPDTPAFRAKRRSVREVARFGPNSQFEKSWQRNHAVVKIQAIQRGRAVRKEFREKEALYAILSQGGLACSSSPSHDVDFLPQTLGARDRRFSSLSATSA